jgi:hypothetical protein
MSFPFAKHVLLVLGTISALSSVFQEAMNEFSIRQTSPHHINSPCLGWPIPP